MFLALRWMMLGMIVLWPDLLGLLDIELFGPTAWAGAFWSMGSIIDRARNTQCVNCARHSDKWPFYNQTFILSFGEMGCRNTTFFTCTNVSFSLSQPLDFFLTKVPQCPAQSPQTARASAWTWPAPCHCTGRSLSVRPHNIWGINLLFPPLLILLGPLVNLFLFQCRQIRFIDLWPTRLYSVLEFLSSLATHCSLIRGNLWATLTLSHLHMAGIFPICPQALNRAIVYPPSSEVLNLKHFIGYICNQHSPQYTNV